MTGKTILAVVEDLYFTTRIESAVKDLGDRLIWGAPDAERFEVQLAEEFIDLVIIDLNWHGDRFGHIALSAEIGKPVIAFGSHKDIETMENAKNAGAKAVVAKSLFVTKFPELVEKYTR